MKRVLMAGVIILLSSNAIAKIDANKINNNIQSAMVSGDPAFGITGSKEMFKKEAEQQQAPVNNIENAQILEIINSDIKKSSIKEKTSFYEIADKQERKKKQAIMKKIEELKNRKPKDILIKANCLIANNILVTLQDFMKTTCQDEEGNYFTLYGDYIADLKNYSLLARPKYLVYNKNNKIIPINQKTSFITNGVETSYNIATTVNTRELEKINLIALKNISKSTAKEGRSITTDLKNANTTTQIAQDSNGNIVKSTNTNKPSGKDIKDRIFYAIITGALDTISEVADRLDKKLPYLYKIQKGSLIKANIFIKK